MKITTRIALGLFLLAALTVGVLSYQLRTVQHLQSINEELSLTNLEAARISIRLVQELEGVREFASKALVLEDPGYVEQWAAWEEAVDQDLERMAELELGPLERQALRDVHAGWERYHLDLAPLRTDEELRPTSVDEMDAVLLRIEELMSMLRASVEEVIDANHAEVARQAEASAVAGERARQISAMAAVGAGVLGLLICIILYLSISGPLKRLTGATREVAEGRFHHRLPAGGGDELSHLARDFNQMAARLNELEDMKRDFVSHVSHELKGPLAAIHETILVLLDRIPGPLNEKQAQLLSLSRQSATRLSGMISNLLQISRIEGGALYLDPERVDPLSVLREVVDELTPLAAERKLDIVVETDSPPQSMMADENRLREVMSNLVGNAIKFSPREATVTARLSMVGDRPDSLPPRYTERSELHSHSAGADGPVRVMDQPGPFLFLEVEDQGPGIPEKHRNGVFEKFYQVRRGVRIEGQGVGLGLSICRNVVEAHGGAIWVDEGIDGGALLRVLLPHAPAHLEDPREAATPDEPPPAGEPAAEDEHTAGVDGAHEGAPADAPEAPTPESPSGVGTST